MNLGAEEIGSRTQPGDLIAMPQDCRGRIGVTLGHRERGIRLLLEAANPGGDFDASASASQTAGSFGAVTWSSAGLLADVQRGVAWDRSPRAAALRSAHRHLESWQRRLEAFATRSRQALRTEACAHPGSRVSREIDVARRLGLSVRLARVAALPVLLRLPVVA